MRQINGLVLKFLTAVGLKKVTMMLLPVGGKYWTRYVQCAFVEIQHHNVTDGQTDRQTDLVESRCS